MTASIGLSDFRTSESGVEGTTFPFKLKFVPHSDVNTLFSGEFYDENSE